MDNYYVEFEVTLWDEEELAKFKERQKKVKSIHIWKLVDRAVSYRVECDLKDVPKMVQNDAEIGRRMDRGLIAVKRRNPETTGEIEV